MNNMTYNLLPRNAFLALMLLFAPAINAGPLDISDAPLFLVTNVPPNILLTIDDSGSMAWAYAPDGIAYRDGEPEFHSSYFNPIYYDPDVTYPPPVDENGIPYTTTFNNAWINGFAPTRGSRDLRTNYRYIDSYDSDSNNVSYSGLYSYVQRAYYFKYDETPASCNPSDLDSVNQKPRDNDCYTKVVLPTDAVQEQNFANWFSFYRTRSLATASAATLAFSQISGETRVGFQLLGNNGCSGFTSNCNGLWDGTTVDSRIRKFGGTHRAGFYDWLARLPTGSGTPLRRSMQRAGEYYKTSEPYEYDPGVTAAPTLACRQNYHIMMTDGIWNGTDPSGIGDEDTPSSNLTLPDGTTYTGALPPYRDTTNQTLADVAFYYWAHDLTTATGLGASDALQYFPVTLDETNVYSTASNVMTPYWNPKNDPANWQHMVNFLVAVGLNTTMTTDPIQWQGSTYASATAPVADVGKGYLPLASGFSSWPSAGSNNIPANVYDLWHAALNSRGQFFSADSPQDIVTAFRTIINRIQARQGSASNLSFNAGSVSSNTQFYQSLFDSSDWKGHLLALPLSDGSSNLTCTTEARGDVCPTNWDAGGVLTGGNYTDPQDPGRTISNGSALDWSTGREIITYDGTVGVPFRWASLSATQKTSLQNSGNVDRGQATLEYLRGYRGCEVGSSVTCSYDINDDASVDATDREFRERSSLLGDIVNSSPTYVGNPERDYPDSFDDLLYSSTDPESGYSTFASPSGKGQRLNVVYIGSSDGMLHGFRTGKITDTNSDGVIDRNDDFDNTLNDGQEVLAYVPSKVYDNLPMLTDPNYVTTGQHRFYVDGEMEVVDAYFSSAWHSVLVSGLGAGGQGLFALDVTDPATFDEANAASIVLWEFDDTDDPDLGNTLGQPNVVRLHNGRWGVIVGNGYNNTKVDGSLSSTGNAVLFVLDVETGTVLAKLDTGVGYADDPTGNSRPNGLGSVTPIDLDADVVTDFVYAADLYGNVWRFDLTSDDPNNWIVSYGSGACASDGSVNCTPLFTAYDTNTPAKAQPISAKVAADKHPLGLQYGVMVYVGTGKYFETTDAGADTTTFNTIYGVWDSDFTTYNAISGAEVGLRSTHTTKYGLTRADLLEQKINFEGLDPISGDTVRVVGDDDVDWAANQGCYVDLLQGNGSIDANRNITNATAWTPQGELVTADPLIVGDALVVSTLIPNDDACSTGGSGWIMAMSKRNCGMAYVFNKGGWHVSGQYYGKAPPGTPAFISKQLYIPLGEGSVAQTEFNPRAEGRKNWSILK